MLCGCEHRRKHEKLETLVIEFRISTPALQKIKSSEIKVRITSIPIYFCVSAIWFNCRTQSISILGSSSIQFDLVRLKYSSIDYDGNIQAKFIDLLIYLFVCLFIYLFI